jgi:hypothetical protein
MKRLRTGTTDLSPRLELHGKMLPNSHDTGLGQVLRNGG